MKRFSFGIAIMLLALGLTACAVKPLVLGEKDSGRTVSVKAGHRLTVELPANMTTGYSWVVADDGDLKQVGESDYRQSSGNRNIVGAGGVQTFKFDAAKTGSGTLKLEYRRPWEKGVAADKTWSAEVQVR